MGMAISVRVSALFLWFLFTSCSIWTSLVSANLPSLVIAQSTELQLSPGLLVEKSPGSKPGSKVVCERVEILGFPRLKNLKKFAHSVKVKVSYVNSSSRPPNVEVCFHRNASLGIGMCPDGQWEKLTKDSWVKSMSPFDHKLLDIRMVGYSSGTLEVSLHEEFFLYRLILIVLGIVMMTFASSLSYSLVFYYGGAMAVGVFLVILMVIFQVAIFLLAFVVLVGAWLGFWVVRKLVLTEDGSIDIGVSHFVAWSIRILASVMILQSSVDPLLAVGALICGVLVSSILTSITLPSFIHRLYENLTGTEKSNSRRYHKPDSSSFESSYDKYSIQRPKDSEFTRHRSSPSIFTPCTIKTRSSRLSDSEPFFSTFHNTPERKRFSKEEWEKFTKESTKRALEGLASSPDFSKWAVAHADRITLLLEKDEKDSHEQHWSWVPWS